MHLESIDTLLKSIDDNILHVSPENIDVLLKYIDQFQQDPSVLSYGHGKNRFPHYVNCLTTDFVNLDPIHQLLRGKVFYYLSKVVSWKKIVPYLPTDVYQLSGLLNLLVSIPTEKETSWYISYFALSWVYILTLAPFKLDEICGEIFKVTQSFQNYPTLKPIVAQIHSQLFLKNVEFFKEHVFGMDRLTINCFLKKIKSYDEYINQPILNHLNSVTLREENDDLIRLKLLPKLFKINAYYENWELVEDIVSFFLSHLNNQFTNYRFTLAHCFAKVIHSLMNDFEENETAFQLIESCIDRTRTLLLEATSIDSDLLHTNLVIIAELSNTIATSLPLLCESIANDIIPHTSRFQQLKVNEIRGTQIRDASNFICWSLARSRQKTLSKEVKLTIFLNLLMSSTFDRDLLVRRSANAALQEVLGRCFSSADLLDNQTIVQIIEIPILNLSETYVNNATKMYELFERQEAYHTHARFLLDWLMDNNVMKNYDLEIVELTVRSLFQLASKFPSAIAHIKIKLDGFISTTSATDSLKCARILLFLVTFESNCLLSSQCIVVLPKIGILVESILKSIDPKRKVHGGDRNEIFKFLTILRYWVFALDNVPSFVFSKKHTEACFHIIRSICDASHENPHFQPLFGKLINRLSRNSTLFSTSEVQTFFWTNYDKFVRFNNTLACSVVSELPPLQIKQLLDNLLPSLDCERKAQLLNSLNDHLRDIIRVTGNRLLYTIVDLLGDYTITQQGDVGRLVRASAANVIASNKDIFWNPLDDKLPELLIPNLLRLCGEQVKQIRTTCFSTLCEVFGYEIKITLGTLNSQLLKFQRLFFEGKSLDFWRGYMMTGGAIHFTDSDVTDAIDEFLKYYYSLTIDQERLSLCNSLVKAMPSAKDITENQKETSKGPLGIMGQDIIKTTVTCLNFWKRIMESGLSIPSDFNFEGFYAKVYNLNLLRGNNALRISTIRIFPHLVSSHSFSIKENDRSFANKIIKRLLVLAQRESRLNKQGCCLSKDCSIEALAQIFLDFESFDQLQTLKLVSINNTELLNVRVSQLLL